MRKAILTLGAALALASCAPAPVPPPECVPTIVQPARGAPVQLLGRVAGCDNLVAVAGDGPGIRLYVLRVRLNLADVEYEALPVLQRGL